MKKYGEVHYLKINKDTIAVKTLFFFFPFFFMWGYIINSHIKFVKSLIILLFLTRLNIGNILKL